MFAEICVILEIGINENKKVCIMKTKTFSARFVSLNAIVLGLVMLAGMILAPAKAFAISITYHDQAFWTSFVSQMRASEEGLAEKIFSVLAVLRGDDDFWGYSTALKAVDDSSLSDVQVQAELEKLMPGVDLTGLAREDYRKYMATLPKALNWIGLVRTVESIEAQSDGATMPEQVQDYVIADSAGASMAYEMLLANMAELGQADTKVQNLFDLISRIYIWPSFREFQADEKVLQAIYGVEYFAQLTETVLQQYASPNNPAKTLWDEVSGFGVANRQAWDGLYYLVHEAVWLMDEDSSRVRNELEILLKQSNMYDTEMDNLVDWQALGVSNVNALTRQVKLAKAKTASVYTDRSELSMLLGNLVCKDAEMLSSSETSQCMLPWWNMMEVMTKIDDSVWEDDGIGQDEIERFGDVMLAWLSRGLYTDYIDNEYDGEACSEGEICEVMTRIKNLTIETEAHVIDGLEACSSQQVTPTPGEKPGANDPDENGSANVSGGTETPKAPNTGSWLMNANGELTDLGAVVAIGGASMAGIVGLVVIVRLYVRKKF